VVLRHKLNERVMVSTGKMETETGFRFGNGKWKRKPVSVSEPDIPESQSMRVCLWSIVVNSENSDPAKNKRADLPAAGKFLGKGNQFPFPILIFFFFGESLD
jgi:hypothetical protein